MTLTDALGIVRGNKDAATQYFKRNTSQELITALTPPVEASLERTNATKYYADIANTYNRLPTSFNKVNPDLTDYVVEKPSTPCSIRLRKKRPISEPIPSREPPRF